MSETEKKNVELTEKMVSELETAAARAVAGISFVCANTASKANQVVLSETVGLLVSMAASLLGLEKDAMDKKIKAQLEVIKSEMAGASAIDKPQNSLPC